MEVARKIHQDRFARRDVVVAGNGIAFFELPEEFTNTGRLG
jgi:hypothetical protein